MSEFDRGYLYGILAASVAFVVWNIASEVISKPPSTRLVVLDRRDMKDNADIGTSDRMAGSNQGTTNP